jgi:hypothetical protein
MSAISLAKFAALVHDVQEIESVIAGTGSRAEQRAFSDTGNLHASLPTVRRRWMI